MARIRTQKLSRFFLLFILLVSPLMAQESEPPSTAPGGSLMHLDSDKHVLRPGDTLDLFISALPELERVYVVRVDGRFNHPLVGDIQASGRTLPELRKDIGAKLSQELRQPTFRLGLLDVARHRVAVLGEVHKQGTFEVGVGATVLDLIAAAGGLGDKADRESAIILRGEEKLEVSLQPEAAEGLTKVQTGDVVYILAGSPVSVSGEVTKPGVYSVSRVSGGPREAILAAGGAREEASLSRVRLLRSTEPEPILIDLRPNADQPLPEKARKLQEGDILIVPARQAVVLGAVATPGPLPLRGNETLIDILPSLVTEGSDIERILVVRSENVMANRDEKEEYNLREYFEDGKADIVVPIRDGDLVYVPAKNRNPGFLNLQNMGVLGLLSIARLFF